MYMFLFICTEIRDHSAKNVNSYIIRLGLIGLADPTARRKRSPNKELTLVLFKYNTQSSCETHGQLVVLIFFFKEIQSWGTRLHVVVEIFNPGNST